MGCEKERIFPNNGKEGLSLANGNRPADSDFTETLECNCYIQITSVENMNTGTDAGWHILEFIEDSEADFCIDGTGDMWKWCDDPYVWHDEYPTPFRQLYPTPDDMHMFYVHFPPNAINPVIHTKVNCYLEGGGYQNLASSVDFDFTPDNGEYMGFFYTYTERFSCFVEPGPEPPVPIGGSDQ